MEDFKIGDIVKLKSGSPKMTIKELDLSNNYAYCVWYSESTLESRDFDTRTLKKAPDRSPGFGKSKVI